jgi:hypothetical protein
MKIKTAPKSYKKKKPPVKPSKNTTIPQNDDPIMMNYLRQNLLSNELIERLWYTLVEKQREISRQMEESEKKFNQRLEETNRLIEESGKKVFLRMEEKNRLVKEKTLADDDENKETAGKTKKTKQKTKSGLYESPVENDIPFICREIIKCFNGQGYYFDDVTAGRRTFFDNMDKRNAEFEIILENTDCLTAVEIIPDPNKKDIENHINKLNMIREHRKKYKDKRKIHGAIVVQSSSAEKQAVQKAGLFLFVQSGRMVEIDIPDNFSALTL